MARKIVTIQTRRGNSSDFDETKMLAGEIATAKDTEQVYISFADGTAEELALKKDIPSSDDNPEVPDTLPNPYPLRFTGAVTGTYDGSKEVVVEIPENPPDSITTAHSRLTGRDAADQHPIAAISGLQAALDRSKIVTTASGNSITLSDTVNAPLEGLVLYGKTTQDGTPSPADPRPLVSAGNSGSITVSVADIAGGSLQTLTVQTPDGLHSAPVTSDGNYTDENGQQWICDEIDFERGKRVTNILRYEETFTVPSGRASGGGLSWYTFPDIPYPTNNIRGVITDIAPLADGEQITTIENKGWASTAPCFSRGEGVLRFYGQPGDYTAEILIVADTPVETPLTAGEITAYKALRTYNSTTDILNDGGAVISVTYCADTRRYIDESCRSLQRGRFRSLGVSLSEKCMRTNRELVDLSQYGAGYRHSDDLTVNEGDVIRITTFASIYYPHFMIFDANYGFLASYFTITGETRTDGFQIKEFEFTVPQSGKYIVINNFSGVAKFSKMDSATLVYGEKGIAKKYFAFGDSVCRGNHSDGSKSDYAWVETFGRLMGMETHNCAIGGQGFMTTAYQPRAIDTIRSTDISDANLITLSFAINDASDASCPVGEYTDTAESTVIGCAYNCISYICSTVPTCQVVVCGSTPQNGTRSERLEEINTKLKQMCEHLHIPFIDLSDCPVNGFNGKSGGALTSDGTHFNDAGYQLLSQFMTGKLVALYGYRQPFIV